MVDDEDFHALERRVTALEGGQRTTHRLALSVDSDVAAVQAQRDADRRVLQALRETQIEDHERLMRLEQGHAKLEQGQVKLERGQARLERGHAQTVVSLRTIIGLLERLQPEA